MAWAKIDNEIDNDGKILIILGFWVSHADSVSNKKKMTTKCKQIKDF